MSAETLSAGNCVQRNAVRGPAAGGTFSLSNIGSVGGTYAAPVVVLPQVVPRLQVVPRYVNKRGDPADVETIDRCVTMLLI